MTTALVIAGHGSTKNAGSRKPICATVQEIRRRELYDRVVCALWKEEPHVSTRLDTLDADDITIVPYFMSAGYYTDNVIPREMKLTGALTLRDGKTIRYTPPIGTHPAMANLIVQRAHEAGAGPADTLVLLGHGTRRNKRSADTIEAQAARVRDRGIFASVLTAFIDQDPHISGVFERADTARIVMVPYFAADGWHVTETIPADLAMESGKVERDGKTLFYAGAVGSEPSIVEIVLELAAAAK